MIYLTLFWEYCKIGLFAVGGGMATMPFLYELADKYHWFTYSQLTDMIAVSESTPGPIGVNMATYSGFTTAGIPGALAATLGLIFPSVVVICIIAKFLTAFRDSRTVKSAFTGLRPASCALITAAWVIVAKNCLLDIPAYEASGEFMHLFHLPSLALGVVLVILTNFVKPLKKLHPIFFILFAAAVGIAFGYMGL